MSRQSLSTAVVGHELIQYEAVSAQAPWSLSGCKRGAFNTQAIAHPADAEIGKLWDHPYRVFFPNLELQDEIAGRLVDLFNRTGLRQISFNGLEGCLVTGEGGYAEARFVKTCYDRWQFEVICNSSQLSHYTWHMHTWMNWGEPWGEAMREGMPEYRFKNQDLFHRNLLPPMLGWFQIQAASAELEATNLDDVEWVLAKCAGFGAGRAWLTDLATLKSLGRTNAILAAVREWDRARHMNVFSEDQRARLRDPKREFHLDALGDDRWQLTPVDYSTRFVYHPVFAKSQPSPSEPWKVPNRFTDQPLRFVLRVTAEPQVPGEAGITNPTFELNGRAATLPSRLKSGQYLVSEGDGKGLVYDTNWNLVRTVQIDSAVPIIRSGGGEIRFRCEPPNDGRLRVEVRFKTVGAPEAASSSSHEPPSR